MSHNTTTIPLPEEISGHSSLPLARIKKIIRLDDDIAQCSNNAAFVIAVATEMFITYLAEQSHNVVKSERKPRRTIQYKDLATAVSRIDNLEFLADVIPKTTTYKKFKEKRAKENAEEAAAGTSKGQRSLIEGHGVESVLETGPPRERKEDPMLLINGDAGSLAQSSPRGPTVVHASGSQSAIVQEDNVPPRGDGDVHMADV